jgi:hypothetical protein
MSLRFGVDDPLDGLVLESREPVIVSDTLAACRRDSFPPNSIYGKIAAI